VRSPYQTRSRVLNDTDDDDDPLTADDSSSDELNNTLDTDPLPHLDSSEEEDDPIIDDSIAQTPSPTITFTNNEADADEDFLISLINIHKYGSKSTHHTDRDVELVFQVANNDDHSKSITAKQAHMVKRVINDVEVNKALTIKLSKAKLNKTTTTTATITTVHTGTFIGAPVNFTKPKTRSKKDVPNDLDWKRMLKTALREDVITAWNKEIDDLVSRGHMYELFPDHAEWAEAHKHKTSGRAILAQKRSGLLKARIVRRGFMDDNDPNEVTYTNLVRWVETRLLLSTPHDDDDMLASIDFAVAYSQGDPIPADKQVYLHFNDPISARLRYFRQLLHLYGGTRAGANWEETLVRELLLIGFTRSDNAPATFIMKGCTLISYVDDTILKGNTTIVMNVIAKLQKRFIVKHVLILTETTPIDFLGCGIYMKNKRIYMCMSTYIEKAIEDLKLDALRYVRSPMVGDIEDNELVDDKLKAWYYSSVGCLGWLCFTTRPDIRHTFTRLSHWLSKPTVSAVKACVRVWAYLTHSKYWSLSSDISFYKHSKDQRWQVFSDSDYCGNSEAGWNRAAMLGTIALHNGMPVLYRSGKCTTAYANEQLLPGHANLSVAVAEIYGLSETSTRTLGLSYVADEMGYTMNKPIVIQGDNAASIVFHKGTAKKSTLVQIDARLKWVKHLRDQDVFDVVYVRSEDNLADLFTKILGPNKFEDMRSRIMRELPPELRLLSLQG